MDTSVSMLTASKHFACIVSFLRVSLRVSVLRVYTTIKTKTTSHSIFNHISSESSTRLTSMVLPITSWTTVTCTMESESTGAQIPNSCRAFLCIHQFSYDHTSCISVIVMCINILIVMFSKLSKFPLFVCQHVGDGTTHPSRIDNRTSRGKPLQDWTILWLREKYTEPATSDESQNDSEWQRSLNIFILVYTSIHFNFYTSICHEAFQSCIATFCLSYNSDFISTHQFTFSFTSLPLDNTRRNEQFSAKLTGHLLKAIVPT